MVAPGLSHSHGGWVTGRGLSAESGDGREAIAVVWAQPFWQSKQALSSLLCASAQTVSGCFPPCS